MEGSHSIYDVFVATTSCHHRWRPSKLLLAQFSDVFVWRSHISLMQSALIHSFHKQSSLDGAWTPSSVFFFFVCFVNDHLTSEQLECVLGQNVEIRCGITLFFLTASCPPTCVSTSLAPAGRSQLSAWTFYKLTSSAGGDCGAHWPSKPADWTANVSLKWRFCWFRLSSLQESNFFPKISLIIKKKKEKWNQAGDAQRCWDLCKWMIKQY